MYRRPAAVGIAMLAIMTDAGADPISSLLQLDEPVVVVQQRTIVYRGEITQSGVEEVKRLLDAAIDARELAIESGGGDVEAGLDLGGLILKHGLDVRVTGDVCLSSCANYVFVAGKSKIIEPGALVLWHGSMMQKNLLSNVDISSAETTLGRPLKWFERWQSKRVISAWLKQIRRREAEFYRALDIDQRITIYGQDVGCGCDWTFSVVDMGKFGLRNVVASESYGYSDYGRWSRPWKMLKVDSSLLEGK
ncbi:hypothetical protein SAMN06296416_103282 [Pseudoxanthomonas wuyuanensis]|uniref:Uncharacterized protein n=3 Tax=Pseudoxanthomonas wuyuanensis TaxID=1073196 RepID=A0A286D6T0_9GAMM|nr:hypothetical protein CSC75_16775 [Pseudoxanthomonas wuyuanensis]SOD54358.1 hypothetical protein SAMN06296416_103282 [Pseudoxanthomonas wuyuanensis]